MTSALHQAVATTVQTKPIVAVVRTDQYDTAKEQAESFIEGGLGLIEVTFSVPEATRLTRELIDSRSGPGAPFIGMGTVSTGDRARQAIDAGAEFIVSPNTSQEVAEVARGAAVYLILGALSCTEIVRASELGADLVKVYPLPPVGGPSYLRTVRQPLSDIRMLAGGGFGIEEIPAYLEAGASAFGIGPPLVGGDRQETTVRCARALALAIGDDRKLPS